MLTVLGGKQELNARIIEPIESNGAIPVNVQDQTSRSLNLQFIKSALVSPTTLTADVAVEDNTITISDTTGFVSGNIVGIFSGTGLFYFGRQIGAPSGSTITLDTPIDRVFTAATSGVISATYNMAVDGSSTTQIFQIWPSAYTDIDITNIVGYMQDTSPMDDSLFGSITSLTYGLVIRKNNGVIDNLATLKNNGEIAEYCKTKFYYTDKAPSGSYGARFVKEFSGQQNNGVAIRLEKGDILESLVQDDLTNLDIFRMMAIGHYIQD